MNHSPDKKSVELLSNAGAADQPQPSERQPSSAQDRRPQADRKGGKTVFLYLAILFAAAFSMLLLAYFVQQRNNETAMGNLHSIGTLIDDNQELRDQLQVLEDSLALAEEKIARLTQENSAQQEELENSLQQQSMLVLYILLEQQIRQENYEAAAATLQSLSQFEEALNLPLPGADPGNSLDLAGRLWEIALTLEQPG